jgi:uracil-DNA glycosylase
MSDPAAQVKMEESWKQVLKDEFSKAYFQQLKYFLVQEKKAGVTVFPPGKLIFSAFDSTPFDKVKVVILGQDPYHGMGQAHGLCFSVQPGIAIPPSLRNIYAELDDDPEVAFQKPNHGYLQKWAEQGVLLLNATLTVRAHQAGSHQGKGWETFTDAAIQAINEQKEGVVFMLWGSYAQRKGNFIDTQKHLVLKAPHPSPLSAHRGFFGCHHFSQCNQFLASKGRKSIDWQV